MDESATAVPLPEGAWNSLHGFAGGGLVRYDFAEPVTVAKGSWLLVPVPTGATITAGLYDGETRELIREVTAHRCDPAPSE